MTTVATLDRAPVAVIPGDEAVCLLEVRNNGSIVESYTVEVVGEPAAWTTAVPPAISVYPGTAEQVALHFAPPRSAAVLAGERAYAVRVTPAEHPDQVEVPEATIEILPFVETTAEIVPRTSKGRWGARHEVSVVNQGNIPVPVTVTGADPDNQLRLGIRPETLTVGPGQAEFVRVGVRSRRLRWRGHPVTLPFQVAVAPETAPVTSLDAATVQTPLLPRNLGRIVAALLVLVLIGAGLWFSLLRPAVKSLAKEATQEQLGPIEKKADEANANAKRAVDKVNAGASPTPTPTAGGDSAGGAGTVPDGATAFASRLQASGGTGATHTGQYTVPAGKTFVLTDIILQNPQGDEGRLDLVVNGSTLLTVALNNFRDLDYHMVSPIDVPAGKVVTLKVTCQKAGAQLAGSSGGGQCRDFALLGGYHRGVTPSP